MIARNISPIIIPFLQILNKEQFFNSGLANVIRWEDVSFQNLSLNLNSDVIFYTNNGSGFNLTEIYSFKAGSPIIRSVGAWDRKHGLMIPEMSIWDRRSNLLGVPMNIGVLGGLSFLMRVNTSRETPQVSGLFHDMLMDLSRSLNFKPNFVLPNEGGYGKIQGINRALFS